MILLTALDRALLALLRVGIAAFGALLVPWVLLLAFAGGIALAS